VKGELARIVFLPGTGFVGFATAKKLGHRPSRNRAKRRVREALRTQPDLREIRLDLVIIVGETIASAPFRRIQDEVRLLVGKARERWESESASS
jgi:ribonuclease P protein component